MLDISESENIYFPKTREYFKEVLSSYANGNYRSAVVMLYSIAICDLLFKLQELYDLYDDSIAKTILDAVSREKNNDSKTKSSWEKELIDKIYKNTELLDDKAYSDICHLYDHRNFSAHPALNQNYELISPSRETAIAEIKNTLDNILTKPPIFAKKIIDMLTEDLAEKQSIFKGQKHELEEYLHRKYYSRMSDNMKKQTFRSLWKLCFCLPEDENCNKNRLINRKAMEILYPEIREIGDFITSDKMFENVSRDEKCQGHLCIFLSFFPEIYKNLMSDVKLQLEEFIESEPDANLVSWFTSNNKKTHLERMHSIAHNTDKNPTYGAKTLMHMRNMYIDAGLIKEYIDFCIDYFGTSKSFDDANKRFATAIRPNLELFCREQFIAIIRAINDNDQIYNRNACKDTDNEIVKHSKDVLGESFDYDKYPNFKYSHELLETSNNEDLDFDEIPF